jgi:hypothetical protein
MVGPDKLAGLSQARWRRARLHPLTPANLGVILTGGDPLIFRRGGCAQ